MNIETLNRANRLQAQIARMERMVEILEENMAVEIKFENGGFFDNGGLGCRYTHSEFISDEEIDEFKNNITSLIRQRVDTRKDQLEKEFSDL